jgi:hypothetical protein
LSHPILELLIKVLSLDGLFQILSHFNFTIDQINSILCGFDPNILHLFLIYDRFFIYSVVNAEYKMIEMKVLKFVDDLNLSQKLGNPINRVYVEVFNTIGGPKTDHWLSDERRNLLPQSRSDFWKERFRRRSIKVSTFWMIWRRSIFIWQLSIRKNDQVKDDRELYFYLKHDRQ